jgi:hypothetical protein
MSLSVCFELHLHVWSSKQKCTSVYLVSTFPSFETVILCKFSKVPCRRKYETGEKFCKFNIFSQLQPCRTTLSKPNILYYFLETMSQGSIKEYLVKAKAFNYYYFRREFSYAKLLNKTETKRKRVAYTVVRVENVSSL